MKRPARDVCLKSCAAGASATYMIIPIILGIVIAMEGARFNQPIPAATDTLFTFDDDLSLNPRRPTGYVTKKFVIAYAGDPRASLWTLAIFNSIITFNCMIEKRLALIFISLSVFSLITALFLCVMSRKNTESLDRDDELLK